MRKLQIKREEWLHGEGADESLLHRPSDNKMCCVGIYLRECGVPLELLTNRIAGHDTRLIGHIPEEARWINEGIRPSTTGLQLYLTNDSLDMTEQEREDQIKMWFKTQDVEVEFV